MPSNMRHPGPGDRDRSFAVSQTDDQQLMSTANLGTVHDQLDLAQMPILGCQPLSGDRLILAAHPDGRVIQEPTQSPNCAQELRFSRNLASDLAQGYRSALVDPHQQPGEVSHLCDPLSGPQFPNSLNPCMILAVDRHRSPPGQVLSGNSTLTEGCEPINYSFGKVSGS